MVTPELLEYIRGQVRVGATKDTLRQTLLSAGGWTGSDVDEAFAKLGLADAPSPPVLPPSPAPTPQQPLRPQAPNISAGIPTLPGQSAAPEPASQAPAPASGAMVMPRQTGASGEQFEPSVQKLRPKHSHKRLIVSLALVLFLIAGSASAAYWYFVLATPSPQELLKRAVLASFNAHSAAFMATSTGTITADVSGGISFSPQFTLTLSGEMDRHATDNPAVDVVVGAALSTRTQSDTGSAAIGAHVIYVDKKLYLDLTNFALSYQSTDPKKAEVQLVLVMINGFVASLENKWIEIDASSTVQTNGPNAADQAALVSYAQGMSYVRSLQNVGVESVGSTPAYHLVLTMQYEQRLADLLNKLYADEAARGNAGVNPTLSASEKDTLNQWVGKTIAMDFWVGKSDYRIYKIAMAPLTIHDTKTSSNATVSLEASYSDWDKPFSITAPAGAQSFQQIMQQLMGSPTVAGSVLSSLQDARVRGRDATRQANLLELILALELYFSDNHSYPNSLSQLHNTQYISPIPTDPSTGAAYQYQPGKDRKSYTLCAKLEGGQPSSMPSGATYKNGQYCRHP